MSARFRTCMKANITTRVNVDMGSNANKQYLENRFGVPGTLPLRWKTESSLLTRVGFILSL